MTESTAALSPRILIVDDNRLYREAFRRNLVLQNYEVLEAENMHEALELAGSNAPDVIITDLQMGTETEGLELIKAVKSAYPLLPIILISAVGTFEEGALAQRYGATAVLSKSRIEDQIEDLYGVIETSRAALTQARIDDVALQQAKSVLSDEDGDASTAAEALKSLLARADLHPYLRREASDLLDQAQEHLVQKEARKAADAVAPAAAAQSGIASSLDLATVEGVLRTAIPAYDSFTEDSKESLRIADFLYTQQGQSNGGIDFSRNIGFSYCFAVENEVKARMAKRLHKFLAHDMTFALIMEMMENNNQSLSVYFHQHLLLLLRNTPMDFTMDNVKQTLRRILEHQGRYKPDGLKALGIMLLCFGRTFQWQKKNRTIKVHNPLGLKGLENEPDVMRFAQLLVGLQHQRNPYIHPEISEMEKLSIIRQTAFECLNFASRIQP